MAEIELNRIALFDRIGRLWTEIVQGRNIHVPHEPRLLLTLVLAMCLAACGGDDSATGASGPCAALSGSYLIHYAQRAGGTCGPIPDYVAVMIPGGASMSETACTGPDQLSADQCTETADMTCVTGGITVNMRGTLHISVDGSFASGVFGITKSNGTQSCSGTHDITYTQQ